MKVHKVIWKGIRKKVALIGRKQIGSVFRMGNFWRWESTEYKGDLIPIGLSEFSAMKMVESNYLRSLKIMGKISLEKSNSEGPIREDEAEVSQLFSSLPKSYEISQKIKDLEDKQKKEQFLSLSPAYHHHPPFKLAVT